MGFPMVLSWPWLFHDSGCYDFCPHQVFMTPPHVELWSRVVHAKWIASCPTKAPVIHNERPKKPLEKWWKKKPWNMDINHGKPGFAEADSTYFPMLPFRSSNLGTLVQEMQRMWEFLKSLAPPCATPSLEMGSSFIHGFWCLGSLGSRLGTWDRHSIHCHLPTGQHQHHWRTATDRNRWFHGGFIDHMFCWGLWKRPSTLCNLG